MDRKIRLISTDFDGTLVAHDSDPVLDPGCIELIGQLQRDGALWTINTGRSVDLLESGLIDLSFPMRPDFILTSERDVFRPGQNGEKWEAYGDWNERCAREHAELFTSAKSVLAEVEKIVKPDTIIATNTSSISIDLLSEAVERKQNFLGMHFFNPVHRMPLVEVIYGKDLDVIR